MNFSLSKITRSFVAVGIVAPCLFQAFYFFGVFPIEKTPEWLLFALWPGFGFYMGADGGADLSGFFGFLMSMVANALVYFLVGALISWCYRRFLSSKKQEA